MFERQERIYSAYEKPEAAEPTERVTLVRDGFYLWALALHIFWLTYHRMWEVLAGYIAVAVCLSMLAMHFRLGDISVAMLQFGLQSMLAVHASTLMGWTLERRGYRFAGVLVAPSEAQAQRRYYEHVT